MITIYPYSIFLAELIRNFGSYIVWQQKQVLRMDYLQSSTKNLMTTIL